MKKLGWRVHTPNLLSEIANNSGQAILQKPLQILGLLLHDVATRAAKINDPALNLLMLRLALYDAGDPDKHPASDIAVTIREQERRMEGVNHETR